MEKNQRIALLFTASIVLLVAYVFFGEILTNYIKDKISKTEEIVETPKNNKKSVKDKSIGKVIDSYAGIKVYYNGRVANVSGRNTTKDGYNLGLKYQCVEFVKRFYYQKYNHRMANSYGHAKEFYDYNIRDGGFNSDRGLKQFSNPSQFKPKRDALLIYGATPFNSFGHVAIITKVTSNSVETISQNLGKGNGTRRTYKLIMDNTGRWKIDESYILGWLSL